MERGSCGDCQEKGIINPNEWKEVSLPIQNKWKRGVSRDCQSKLAKREELPIQIIGKHYAGRVGGYGRIFGVKIISFLVETFSFYQKMGFHIFSSNFLV